MTNNQTLGDIAAYLGAELIGDPSCLIQGMAAIDKAEKGQVTFLLTSAYHRFLASTKASAVIIQDKFKQDCPTNALVMHDPKLGYAKLARLFLPPVSRTAGIHSTAVVGEGCHISPTASIGPQVVIGDRVRIGDHTVIGPGTVIGDDCTIGHHCLFAPKVTFYHGVKVKDRCEFHSGVVIGADGFGLVNDHGQWLKIPQLGGVTIGSDVEIGANTSVDRGALDDTIIEDGVKIDNQVQVAHNVHIGAHSAIAACAGIAGSVKIGQYCLIGGAVGITDHAQIADGTILTAATLVSKSIKEPGIYSSAIPMLPRKEFERNAVVFRNLSKLSKRVKALEQSGS